MSDYLIDIHSQHQTLELSNQDFQITLLDSLAKNQNLVSQYKSELSLYKKIDNSLKELISNKNSLDKEQDYNTFLLEELLEADLKLGEQEILESELEMLNNVEFIKENIEKSIAISEEEQFGVIQNLKEIRISLQKISGLSSVYNQLFERVNSVVIELEDINQDLNSELEKLVFNPEKLELVNQKLQTIYLLQKKHQVETIDELIAIKNELDAKVFLSNDIENQIAAFQNQLQSKRDLLDEVSKNIHENRVGVVPNLTQRLSAILLQLGMSNAQFQFEINFGENFLSNGKDDVQLLFSANKGSNFGLLKKVASGGEMSRIMLAIKSVLAEETKLPTIIFDEIDTGISGEIANNMAEIMKKMSNQMQIFAITHLPQIASKGEVHYKVFKTTKENTTVSEIILLNENDRILEIAEMLSGKNPSESALTHAKTLLN